ncbi:subclass IId bacteriocin thuricin17 [Bacillus tropicus]|nr:MULTISPECIES: subclass IId bacteriocin thuricin17 [Bacillus]MDA1548360.1 subclass IId bacteriocin thuricin17 [Bacillus cereus group sp. TH243-3LC]MDA1560074.1 subclass IId bacteriocin thuricin17 [Bacillus cereus group sp. TH243-1LC]MDA1642124.1 subclass IId bacteriocin thuricin17 [Bacillus cereus group sp. TH177-1LC]MDA1653388.1 subclass IId bacteriocin thuricin17 [Bacillus cereus group sp. TH150LC]MDA1857431.1 subclass IId bacteriocin thuricin17 [Bacillus cereus group sp. BY122LC]
METPVVQPRDWTCWSCLVYTACSVELLNLVTAANGASTAS